MPSEKPKVVIIRLSSFGDIVLSTVAVEILKDDLDIFFLTKEEYKEILYDNPYVKVLTVKSSSLYDIVISAIGIRKSIKPDYVLDLHNKIPTIIIRKILGGISFVWDAQRIERRKAILSKNFENIKHTVQRFAEISLRLKSQIDNIQYNKQVDNIQDNRIESQSQDLKEYYPRIFLPASPRYEKLAEFLTMVNPKAHILISPESRVKAKMWNVDECNKLILELEKKGFIVSVIGADKGNSLLYHGKHKFFGELSISDLKLLINSATAVISVDSGVMHMAAALGKPVVAIFTSSTPELGFSPYGASKFRIVEYGKLYCRPCSLHPKECPEKHHICSKIPHTKVLKALDELLF